MTENKKKEALEHYDQFGSGAAFRAFEERLLGLDYAIEGLEKHFASVDDFERAERMKKKREELKTYMISEGLIVE